MLALNSGNRFSFRIEESSHPLNKNNIIPTKQYAADAFAEGGIGRRQIGRIDKQTNQLEPTVGVPSER